MATKNEDTALSRSDQSGRSTADLRGDGSGGSRHPLKMNAYYFGFTPTRVELVDRILSAVAHAGKGYHHTESWCEPIEDWHVFRGGNYGYAGWIQRAAEDAAVSHRELLSALKAMVASYDGIRDVVRSEAILKKLADADAAIAKAEATS